MNPLKMMIMNMLDKNAGGITAGDKLLNTKLSLKSPGFGSSLNIPKGQG
jgi:hypothetical protein